MPSLVEKVYTSEKGNVMLFVAPQLNDNHITTFKPVFVSEEIGKQVQKMLDKGKEVTVNAVAE